VMPFVRYGLPAVLFLAGIVMLVLEPNTIGLEGFAMATGAALAVLLLNALFRAGVKGDRERDREEQAREYLVRHGHWPDEER
jgi:predicted membrane metal-binding protein